MRSIKFTQDTQEIDLRFNTTSNNKLSWSIECFSERYWGGYKDKRNSISGWTIILNYCLISWGSRQQGLMTMFRSKEELVVAPEFCKEVIFVRNILKLFREPVKYPIVMNVDNVGSICLFNNGSGKHMRHVDIRGFYIRDYVENKAIKIQFIKSEENMADPYTKNVKSKFFHDHHGTYMFQDDVRPH